MDDDYHARLLGRNGHDACFAKESHTFVCTY